MDPNPDNRKLPFSLFPSGLLRMAQAQHDNAMSGHRHRGFPTQYAYIFVSPQIARRCWSLPSNILERQRDARCASQAIE
jgi:hypothetical protein